MADYSHLGGSVPVTSAANGVWEIQKKRKTGDQRRQNGKTSEKKEKGEDKRHFPPEADREKAEGTDDADAAEDYGSRRVAKMSHQIDVKI